MERARVTWLGHATALIDMGPARLLTDPVLRRRVAHIVRLQPPVDPDPVDAVLISHAHYDHLDLPTLRALGKDMPLVVPRGLARFLNKRGFHRTIELSAGDRWEIDGVTIRAVHADHPGNRPPFRFKAEAVGYVVEGDRRVYFAGDTDVFPGMREIGDLGLDAALLPVAGWGPRVPAGHLDPQRAAEAAALLRPVTAVPIHWGTYATVLRRPGSGDAIRRPPLEFARCCAQAAPDVRVRVLDHGESLDLVAGGAAS